MFCHSTKLRAISAGGGLASCVSLIIQQTWQYVSGVGREYNHIPVLNTILLFGKLFIYKMSVESLEKEMEVLGITTRERVLGDPDLLDIIFSYLDPPSVKSARLVSK